MKCILIILLLIPFSGHSQFYEDTWTGKDKFTHFAYCTGISTFSGALLQDGFKFKYGYEAGIAVAIGVGIWKETTDYQPSYQDLTYDVLGAFAGYALNKWYQAASQPKTVEQIEAKNERKRERRNGRR